MKEVSLNNFFKVHLQLSGPDSVKFIVSGPLTWPQQKVFSSSKKHVSKTSDQFSMMNWTVIKIGKNKTGEHFSTFTQQFEPFFGETRMLRWFHDGLSTIGQYLGQMSSFFLGSFCFFCKAQKPFSLKEETSQFGGNPAFFVFFHVELSGPSPRRAIYCNQWSFFGVNGSPLW